MGLELRQELVPKQKMELDQRIAMKQKLTLSMTAQFEGVRDEVSGPPEELLEVVIKEILSQIENKDLKDGLGAFLSDESLKMAMINNVGEIALCDKKRIYDFIIRYFYDKFGGNFSIQDRETRKEELVSVEKGNFREAFVNKNKLAKDRDDIYELVKTTANSGQGSSDSMMERARDMGNALRVAEVSEDQVKTLQQGLTYALLSPDSEGRPMLADFLREYLVLKHLNIDLSERLQKRFVDRFSKVGQKSKPEQFELAFLNTIGEATLISMGILSPEIFALQKAELDREVYKEMKEDLAKNDVDFDKLLKDYSLKGYGTIFWNRWKMVGQKLSPVTDDKIREFLTSTVRQDAGRVKKIFNYEDFFELIKGINSEGGRDREDRENGKVELREALVELFENTDKKEEWIKLIKEQWLDKLNIFMEAKQEKAAA